MKWTERLKRIFLPFEFPDHPLYAKPQTEEEDEQFWDEFLNGRTTLEILERDPDGTITARVTPNDTD